MVLNLHKYGLLELSMPSPKTIHAAVGLQDVGVEALEADRTSHLFMKSPQRWTNKCATRAMAIRPRILELMSPLVSPWQEHFIQYDTNPEIDSFFRNQGLIWARSHYEPGQDAFPPDVTFGDLPFHVVQGSRC